MGTMSVYFIRLVCKDGKVCDRGLSGYHTFLTAKSQATGYINSYINDAIDKGEPAPKCFFGWSKEGKSYIYEPILAVEIYYAKTRSDYSLIIARREVDPWALALEKAGLIAE